MTVKYNNIAHLDKASARFVGATPRPAAYLAQPQQAGPFAQGRAPNVTNGRLPLPAPNTLLAREVNDARRVLAYIGLMRHTCNKSCY